MLTIFKHIYMIARWDSNWDYHTGLEWNLESWLQKIINFYPTVKCRTQDNDKDFIYLYVIILLHVSSEYTGSYVNKFTPSNF